MVLIREIHEVCMVSEEIPCLLDLYAPTIMNIVRLISDGMDSGKSSICAVYSPFHCAAVVSAERQGRFNNESRSQSQYALVIRAQFWTGSSLLFSRCINHLPFGDFRYWKLSCRNFVTTAIAYHHSRIHHTKVQTSHTLPICIRVTAGSCCCSW